MVELSLVVDVGHTRTKFAVCRSVSQTPLPEIVDSLAVRHDQPIDWEKIGRWDARGTPIVIGTHVPQAKEVIRQWPSSLTTPVLFTDKSRLPLKVDVDFPDKVGMDRLLNAVAANLLRGAGQPAITIGTGTAITIDAIDADGVFRGGAILPGILLGAKSLYEATTTLPHIDVWELLKQEPATLGRNTEAAIASGLYWGHLGAIRELIQRETDWLRRTAKVPPLLLLTGGASRIVAPYLSASRQIDELALRALAAIAHQVVPT